MKAYVRRHRILEIIPKQPRRISVQTILSTLRSNYIDSNHITERSIQRDLVEMSEDFPDLYTDKAKPAGWYKVK